jgi:hypothetical protein
MAARRLPWLPLFNEEAVCRTKKPRRRSKDELKTPSILILSKPSPSGITEQKPKAKRELALHATQRKERHGRRDRHDTSEAKDEELIILNKEGAGRSAHLAKKGCRRVTEPAALITPASFSRRQAKMAEKKDELGVVSAEGKCKAAGLGEKEMQSTISKISTVSVNPKTLGYFGLDMKEANTPSNVPLTNISDTMGNITETMSRMKGRFNDIPKLATPSSRRPSGTRKEEKYGLTLSMDPSRPAGHVNSKINRRMDVTANPSVESDPAIQLYSSRSAIDKERIKEQNVPEMPQKPLQSPISNEASCKTNPSIKDVLTNFENRMDTTQLKISSLETALQGTKDDIQKLSLPQGSISVNESPLSRKDSFEGFLTHMLQHFADLFIAYSALMDSIEHRIQTDALKALTELNRLISQYEEEARQLMKGLSWEVQLVVMSEC